MEELKKIIATNLSKYRKAAKLTQRELAQKLLYSDKNISKWERGDSIPDVIVLKKLADLYSVTVNDFFIDSTDIIKGSEQNENFKKSFKTFSKKQFLIALLSMSAVWFVAILLYGALKIFTPLKDFAWWSFIIALPISAFVLLVFTSLWGTNLMNVLFLSVLIWTTALALYLCIDLPGIWLIFIIAIPLQVLDILWFIFRKISVALKSKKENSS